MSNIEEIPILRNNVQNSIKWRREIVQREKSSFFKTIAMALRFEMRDKVNHCTFLEIIDNSSLSHVELCCRV